MDRRQSQGRLLGYIVGGRFLPCGSCRPLGSPPHASPLGGALPPSCGGLRRPCFCSRTLPGGALDLHGGTEGFDLLPPEVVCETGMYELPCLHRGGLGVVRHFLWGFMRVVVWPHLHMSATRAKLLRYACIFALLQECAYLGGSGEEKKEDHGGRRPGGGVYLLEGLHRKVCTDCELLVQ